MRFCEEYILFLVSYGVREMGTGMSAPGVGYGLQGGEPIAHEDNGGSSLFYAGPLSRCISFILCRAWV
jgi:hypothetical protein